MSKSTISTFQLFALIPDAEAARLYLEKRLWPNGAACPTCAGKKRITVRKNGVYRCNQCKLDFTVRTGTIFERSHVPLNKWIYAMYLVVTARKGICLQKLLFEGNRLEYRFAYYKESGKGRWVFGRYALTIPAQELGLLLKAAQTEGWDGF